MSENNTINSRIAKIINDLPISAYAFAKATGISQPLIHSYITTDKNPSSSMIEKILLTYPDIDANWLLTGKGSMIKEGNYTEGRFAINAPFVSKYEIDNYINNCNNAEYIMKLPKISIIPTTREFGHTAFEVVDDSMVDSSEGCLKPGDIIICSAFEKESIFNVSAKQLTCLIFHKELGYMIRLVKDFNKENKSIAAIPLNPLYKDALISLDDITKIFFVHQAIVRY